MKLPVRQNKIYSLTDWNNYQFFFAQPDKKLNKISGLTPDIYSTPVACCKFIDVQHQWLKSRFSIKSAKLTLIKQIIAKLGLASSIVSSICLSNYPTVASVPLASKSQLSMSRTAKFVSSQTEAYYQQNTVTALLGKISTEEETSLSQPSFLFTSWLKEPLSSFYGGILLNFGIFSAVYSFIYQEVTAHKHTKSILQKERRFSSAVLDSIDALVVVLDPQGRIICLNRACEQATGYHFNEVQGKFFGDLLVLPEEIEKFQRYFDKLNISNFPKQYEHYCQIKNGQRILINWSNNVVLNAQNELDYIISIGIDVSDRQEYQEQLFAKNYQLATLIDNFYAGILVEDESGQIVIINQDFCQIFNISETPDSLIGLVTDKAIFAATKLLLYPDMFSQRVTQILTARQIVNGEEITLANGKVFERDYIPIFIEDNYRGHVWKYRDITACKQSEKALKQQLVAVESAMDGIAILNEHSQFTYLNDAHVQLFGYDHRAELIGKTWRELYQQDEITHFEQEILPLLQQTGKWRGKATAKRKDGTTFAEEVSLTLIPGMGLICVCRDITERVKAEEALKHANIQLTSWVGELEQRNREITLLGHMSEVLQACLSLEEAYRAIPSLVQPLFPNLSGDIFLFNQSQELLEAVASWGTVLGYNEAVFTAHECWALKRCRTHLFANNHSRLRCQHINQDAHESICIPLITQGKPLGLLHLTAKNRQSLSDSQQHLAATVAEHIALALGNLKLRETLQNQSIRDPLTGLFNRRYMQESLTKELHRVTRKQQTLSIVMLDVDYFKRFNDTYGHEAGDLVLRELAAFLQANVRFSDIACRYGGEELTLILPETSLEDAYKRAEQLRQGAKEIQLHYRQQYLDTITLSAGVACYPQHALSTDALIRSADAALYAAKARGRDRVVIASSIQSVA